MLEEEELEEEEEERGGGGGVRGDTGLFVCLSSCNLFMYQSAPASTHTDRKSVV